MDRFTAQGRMMLRQPPAAEPSGSHDHRVAGAGFAPKKSGEPLVAAVPAWDPLTFKLVGPITTARVVL